MARTRNNDLTGFIEYLKKKKAYVFLNDQTLRDHKLGVVVPISFSPDDMRRFYDEYLLEVSKDNATPVANVTPVE